MRDGECRALQTAGVCGCCHFPQSLSSLQYPDRASTTTLALTAAPPSMVLG